MKLLSTGSNSSACLVLLSFMGATARALAFQSPQTCIPVLNGRQRLQRTLLLSSSSDSNNDDLTKVSFWKKLDENHVKHDILSIWAVIASTEDRRAVIVMHIEKRLGDEFFEDYRTPAGKADEGKVDLIISALRESDEKVVGTSFDRALASIVDTEGSVLERLWLGDSNGSRHDFTYYVGNVKFRHRGKSQGVPNQVYLLPLTLEEHQNENVHVFMTPSGTGKSVELAGSAFQRAAALALVVTETTDIVAASKEEREEATMAKLSSIVKELSRKYKTVLDKLIEVALAKNEDLKLVLAFDEASRTPTFLRGLIANHEKLGQTAAKILQKQALPAATTIKVVFSVAGAGVSTGSVGSLPADFVELETSAQRSPKEVYDALCAEYNKSSEGQFRLPTYDELKEVFPVLFTAAQHNARMTSIAVGEMSRRPMRYNVLSMETSVLHKTLISYINSNGLAPLLGSDPGKAQLAGAQALAVHLFQEKVDIPNDIASREELAGKMEYTGINFDNRLNPFSMLELVVQAGLLRPVPFPSLGSVDKVLEKPFRLDPAMQLVCLYLMQLPAESTALIRPSSFGFEVMSTHLIKSALAATLSIEFAERPVVHDVLSRLGFSLPDSVQGAIRTWWEGLKDVKVVHSQYRAEFRATHLQQSEASVGYVKPPSSKKIILSTFDSASSELVDEEWDTNKYFQYLKTDKDLVEQLFGMTEGSGDEMGVPLTSVATGSSHLHDGSVTFMGRNVKTGLVEKYSIQNQSKDYFGRSGINEQEVQNNRDRCMAPVLDGPYGSSRGFCLSSRAGKLKGKDFLHFAVDNSEILNTTMRDLDDRRNKHVQLEKHSTTCRGPEWRMNSIVDTTATAREDKSPSCIVKVEWENGEVTLEKPVTAYTLDQDMCDGFGSTPQGFDWWAN